MSFKQYMVLFLLFMGYLFLGAYLFYSVERPVEEERRELAKAEALEIKELLRRHYADGLPEAHMELLTRLSDYCGKPLFLSTIRQPDTSGTRESNSSEPEYDEDVPYEEKPFLWTFYNSFLFVLCTLSTIGYGNLAPTTRHGRILDVIYGLIGIPFYGIILAQMSEYFGALFMRAHHRYKSHEYQTRLSLLADILTYLLLGMVVFIFFPAAIFVYFEDWNFDTGVYYAFVTLATIGYGDLVAGQADSVTWIYDVYKFMVLVWIMFGLGYMLMIVGFLTRAMRSKKVRKIEHRLANTIKQTQSKIWNEFSQDVTYLRRMLNEMYLLKIEPVYIEKEGEDDKEGIQRTKSCPNLSEWPVLRKIAKEDDSSSEADEEEMAAKFRQIAMKRRTGNAENVMAPRIQKTVSEGDLSRIDRKATFGEDTNAVDPKLLLAKVVDALGTSVGSKFSLEDEKEEPARKISSKLNGIHGFSDDEILASEKLPSRWSMGLKRTISEQPSPSKRNSVVSQDESRTWGGVNPADIQRFIKMRANGEIRRPSQGFDTTSISSEGSKSTLSEQSMRLPPSRMRRMSMAVTSLFSQGKKAQDDNKELRGSKKKRRTGNIPGMLPTISNGKRHSLPQDDQDESILEQVNYLTQATGRRGSLFAALANELGSKAGGSNVPVSPVLEQTSVADFLRLLSSLQAKLDPTLSDNDEEQKSITSRGKLGMGSPNSRDSAVINPLAMLFSTPTPPPVLQPISGPANLPHQGTRNISLAKSTNLLQTKAKECRRFSLVPPMDVDHPSGQINRRDILKLTKRSTSSQNMLQQSDGSPINIPNITGRQRPTRTSLSGSAKYINSKLQNSPDAQKAGPPTFQGYRKFTVRPVSSPDFPLSSNTQSPLQTLPKITVEHCDGEPSNTDAEDEDSLKDVVVVRL